MGTWNTVTTLIPTNYWQFTAPIAGTFFKLKCLGFVGSDSFFIAQGGTRDQGVIILEKPIVIEPIKEEVIIELKAPIYLDSRRIAVKSIPPRESIESILRKVIDNRLLIDNFSSLSIGGKRTNKSVEISVFVP